MRAGQSLYRDRTQEFHAVAERLKKSFSSAPDASPATNGAGVGGSGSRFEGTKAVASMQSEFNKRASKIGLGIHQTSQKLAKLAKCKRRSHH